jgi:hypothetical protein
LFDAFQELQEGFLNQIFGQRPVAIDQPKEVSKQRAVMALDQGSQVLTLPGLYAEGKLLVA